VLESGPQWPRGLRRGSAAARLLGSWVRIPPVLWIVLSGAGLCVGLTNSPEDCGVSECDRESLLMRRSWPTRGCCAMGEKIVL
jgi:hypothetical protein